MRFLTVRNAMSGLLLSLACALFLASCGGSAESAHAHRNPAQPPPSTSVSLILAIDRHKNFAAMVERAQRRASRYGDHLES